MPPSIGPSFITIVYLSESLCDQHRIKPVEERVHPLDNIQPVSRRCERTERRAAVSEARRGWRSCSNAHWASPARLSHDVLEHQDVDDFVDRGAVAAESIADAHC